MVGYSAAVALWIKKSGKKLWIGVEISSPQLWPFVATWGIKNDFKSSHRISSSAEIWNAESHVVEHLFLITSIPLSPASHSLCLFSFFLFPFPYVPLDVRGQISGRGLARNESRDGPGNASLCSSIESRFRLKSSHVAGRRRKWLTLLL